MLERHTGRASLVPSSGFPTASTEYFCFPLYSLSDLGSVHRYESQTLKQLLRISGSFNSSISYTLVPVSYANYTEMGLITAYSVDLRRWISRETRQLIFNRQTRSTNDGGAKRRPCHGAGRGAGRRTGGRTGEWTGFSLEQNPLAAMEEG